MAKKNPLGEVAKLYPHGHPRFAEITLEEMRLHSDKNHDYAAGGDPLGNFKRQAQFFSHYPGLSLADPSVLSMVYSMKQIDAFFWLKSNGHVAKVEGAGRRLEDVSVYAKLSRIMTEEE